jgi:alanyl-tRNA synthetase
MNNYIVDTGYGLERFVWASKGSPTIYDAIFPDLVRKVADMAGVEHNLKDPEYAEIFAQNARLAGMVDLEASSMRELRAKIASSIGIPPEKLEKTIAPMERIYAVVDHTRCLAFMLGDGIIPSNVKAGYLAGLVIRRTLRLMKELGWACPCLTWWRCRSPVWITRTGRRGCTIEEILTRKTEVRRDPGEGKRL